VLLNIRTRPRLATTRYAARNRDVLEDYAQMRGINLLMHLPPLQIRAMAVTSSNIPASAQGPNRPNSSHLEFAWLPVIILPLLALTALILLGAQR
jgi:hypothetical protein